MIKMNCFNSNEHYEHLKEERLNDWLLRIGVIETQIINIERHNGIITVWYREV